MPVWTAETQNPYYISRMIPIMLADTAGLQPRTVEVEKLYNFQITSNTDSLSLLGRWILLAWRANPTQSGSADVSVTVDGQVVSIHGGLSENQYVVGPNIERNSPTGGTLMIPRFLMSEEEIILGGTSGAVPLETVVVAVRMEYA